jgi:hypothetical protein
MSHEWKAAMVEGPVTEAEKAKAQLADATALLGRIHHGEADRALLDDGMVVEWIDREIAAYIRKYGPLPKGNR